MRHWMILAVSFLVGACGPAAYLGSIGEEPIELREYEDVFARNKAGWENAAATDLEERKEFLDLFLAYKLKLREASARGLPQDSSIQAELEDYRTSAATMYVLEKELIEPSIRTLYDRRKTEVRASHILVSFPAYLAPEDTFEAWHVVHSLLSRADTVSFDSLARRFSQDTGTKEAGGDVGWFSQGRMVRPFEDAVYALKPGEMTRTPVRTNFGYHIIKLTGRRPNQGLVQIAHVLKRFGPQSDSSAVRDTVSSIASRIKNGSLTFEDAVERYSEDPSTKNRGGIIGSFERTRLPADVADLLFSLPVGAISEPYQAPYGFHIFKVVERLPFPSFQELQPELRQNYQQQSFAADYQQYMSGLKETYGFSMDDSLFSLLASSFDSTATTGDSSWRDGVPPAILGSAVCFYRGDSMSVEEVLDAVEAETGFSQAPLTPSNARIMIERIMESRILALHASRVIADDPEFLRLMDEYRDGILIYRLDQEEVWKHITVSDSLLRAYHEQNRERYRWGDRIALGEIHVKSDSLAAVLYQSVMQGADFDSLAIEYTVRPGHRQKTTTGLQSVHANELTTKGNSMEVGRVSLPFRYEKGVSIIKVLQKDSARPKTFDEARQELTGDYQEHVRRRVEGEWIRALKEKYRVELYPERVADAFRRAR